MMKKSVSQSNVKQPVSRWGLWIAFACLTLAAVSGRAQAPANDNFANAIPLGGVSGSISGTTFGATHEAGERDHVNRGSQHSVWYRWVATGNGVAVFNTFGSSYDTMLAAYTGNNVAALTLFAENDDARGSLDSEISFPVQLGVEYRIVVDGYQGSSGDFVLSWFGPTNSAPPPPPPSETNHVRFSLAAYNVNENAPGFATIDVDYTGSSPGPVSVNWAIVAGGTAVAGTDYLSSQSGTLTFDPGVTTRSFTIQIVDNGVANANKTINLRLSNVTGGASLGTQNTAVVNIRDDETTDPRRPAGQFQFSSPIYNVTENETTPSFWGFPIRTINGRNVPGALITVTRTGGSTGRVMVDYSTVDDFTTSCFNTNGIGVANCDYTPRRGTLVFDDFQTSTNFLVPILQNDVFSPSNAPPPRAFTVILSNPRPDPAENPELIIPTLGSLTNATIRVAQVNEFIGFAIERATWRIDEAGDSDGGGVFVDVILPFNGIPVGQGGHVTLETYRTYDDPLLAGSDYADGSTNLGGVFSYQNPVYTDGSPDVLNPTDFLVFSQEVSFPNTGNPPGFRQRVRIPINDDDMVEFNEDIRFRLVPIPGEPIPVNRTADHATLTVLFDDQPAGALDRDWNPDFVSSTSPPFNPTPGANNSVHGSALQADQKVVLVGEFTAYNTVPRNRVARINTDGSLDTGFAIGTGANDFVSSVVIYSAANTNQANKIVIAGAFTSFDGVQRNRIARLNSDGTVDLTFNPGDGANGVVRSMVLLSSGKILIGGEFTSVNGIERNGVARLNENGSVDLSFNPGTGANGPVWSLALDNSSVPIQVGAGQSGFGPAEFRTNIETRASSGTITIIFYPACVPDTLRVYYGTALIFDSGPVNEFNGDPNCDFNNFTGPLTYVIPYGPGAATDITIVINEGSGDPGTVWAFDATIENSVAGSRVLVGGEFTEFNSIPRGGVARLSANGALDLGFNPGAGADGPIYAVAVQPSDLKVLIGGAFHDIDFRSRNGFARLNADGTLDTTFNPGDGVNDSIYSIAIQRDGKSLIGGVFTKYDNTRRVGLARIFTNGVLDTSFLDTAYNQFAGLINSFSFEPANFVNTILPYSSLTNEYVLIGGSFTHLGGNAISSPPGYARVWTRQDRRNRYNVARLIGGYTPGPGNAQFAFPNYTVDENSGSLAVTLQRVDGRLGTLMADVITTNRLAQSGIDYTFTKVTEVWPEYAYPARPRSVGFVGLDYVTIPILDDNLIEGNEFLDLGLGNALGNITLAGEPIPLGGARGRAAVPLTITDNDFDRGILAFESANYVTNENGGAIQVTIVRTNGWNNAVSVTYFTVDGTAISGQDYTGRTNTITFPEGTTNRVISIPILNDTGVEFDETFFIVLTNATGGARLPGGLPTSTTSTMVTITDNDFSPGRLNFSVANFATNEAAGFAQIVVTRSGGSVGAISVDAAATNGTAVSGVDFTAVTNRLSWANGDSAPKVFNVPIINDQLVEGNRTVNLSLFNASTNGAIGNRPTATLTILEDDTYGAFAFSQANYEGNENGTNLVITVVRVGGSAGTVRVDYHVRDGSAVRGVDYLATDGTLEFLPGETSKTFLIQLLDDTASDGIQTVLLSLANPSGAPLGNPSTALLSIIDDESSNTPAGSLDTTFNSATGANNPIYALGLQTDGKLLIAGDFTAVNGVTRQRLARLLSDGSLDPTYNVGLGPNRPVRAVKLQPDGKALVGGFFTRVHGTNINRLARLNTDGSLDVFFNPGAGADNPVYALDLLPDGRVVVGGAFTTFNGISRPNVAVLNTNGTVSTTFNPGLGANGVVYAVAAQPDGKVVIAGDFTTVNNVSRVRVARLNTDGSVDTTFNPQLGANAAVRALAIQADGKIILGGSFTTLNGLPRNYLARLNTDGSVDPIFLGTASGGDNAVYALAIQADGKILVVGDFTTFNGVTRNRITRLNPNGKTDPTINFGTGANSFIAAVTVQPDRKIVIGGGFTVVDGEPRSYVARLHGGSLAGPGRIEFSEPLYTVNENATNAVIVVRRTGGTTGDVSVDYSMADGTAINLLDYTNRSGTITFPEGEVRQTFLVPLINDTAVEDPETVDLALSNPVGASLGLQPTSTLVILSDDSIVSFLTASFSVNENAISGNATISVARTGATNTTVAVDYLTRDGTARAGQDYIAVSDSITFLPGETLKIFTIPIFNDAIIEGNETVLLSLTNVTVGGFLGLSSSTLTIVDDDFAAGTLVFSSPVYTVNEFETNITITVVRTNGSTGVVSVDYSTSDGTARAGEDYTSVGGTLAFADGETSKTFNVAIVPDYLNETNETVILVLSNPTGGATLGGNSTATLTILNNNLVNGSLNFAETNFTVIESNLVAVLTLTRTFGDLGPVSVLVRTFDGTATAPSDYSAISNIVSWADRDSAPKTITVPITDDSTVENSESFGLVLSDPTGGATLGVRPTATITIEDDDVGPGNLSFTSDNFVVDENGTNAVITVTRSFGHTGPVSINFATVGGGTAVPGSDYVATNGTLVFADGETNKAFLVPIIDDFVVDVNKTVNLILSNPTGGASTNGQIIAATLTISENEQQAGSIDASFGGIGANAQVYAVLVQTNANKLFAAGDFTSFNGLPRRRVARLNANGSLDTSFDAADALNNSVRALALQSDGKLLAGGAFTNVPGVSNSFLARLDLDGSVDTNFLANRKGVDNFVYAIGVQSDGKIVVGGAFTSVNDSNRQHLARLESNGALDVNFNPSANADATIWTIALQNDGKMLIGGDFSLVSGATRMRIARLNPDGSLDTSFNPGVGPSGSVRSISVQPDGRVLIGGLFTNVNGVVRSRIARLNENGTVDASFDPGAGADEFVSSVVLQSDGKILVGGGFVTFNGVPHHSIVRLLPTGAVDTSINFGAGANNYISAVALQADKKIVIGGAFTEFDGVQRNYIARLNGGENLGFGSFVFSAASYSVVESGTNILITVKRLIGGTNTVSVNFQTVDGTAVAGTHYRGTNGTLTFLPGESVKTFVVPIINNPDINPDRVFIVVLSNPVGGASLGTPSTAQVVIINDDDALGFNISSYSVSENAGFALITVVRTGGSVGVVTVDYTTVQNTAVAGIDYIETAGTLVFTNGQTVQTFSVPIIDDAVVEGNESLDLLLIGTTGTAILGQAAATLTIVDDDFSPGLIGFSSPVFSVSERGGFATISVSRSIGSSGAASIDFVTGDGTATSGADYAPTSGRLVFADTEITKTFTIAIYDDALAEGPETVNLTLSNPVGAAIGQGTATLTILGDEALFNFAQTNFFVVESNVFAAITVTRSTNGTGPIGVMFATSNNTAVAGSDYIATNGVLSWPADDFTPRTFTVQVINDLVGELTEDLGLYLLNPTGESALGPVNPVPLTILDDDSSFSFDSSSYFVSEGSTNAVITIVRTGFATGPASVNFATSDGTARAGEDYVFTGVTVNFTNGQTVATVNVPIIDDAIGEPDETVNLILQTPSAGTALGVPSTATLTIVENEDVISFASATFSATENSTNAIITVIRRGIPAGPLSVNFATTAGTATPNSDYTNVSGVLNFGFFETVKTFTVPIVEDAIAEGNETVNLQLFNLIGGPAFLVAPTNATLTILDNDVAVRFSAAAYNVGENQTNAVITVTRIGAADTAFTVAYASSNGTAIAGQDYGAVSGVLSFGVGQTTRTFTVPILDDLLIEGNESLTVRLFNVTPPSIPLVSPSTATVNIVDDDASIIVAAGAALQGESISPPNGLIDPGELVTVNFGFRNVGNVDTTSLLLTLLNTNGVVPNGTSQRNLGVLAAGGPTRSTPFSFTANGTNGGRVIATFLVTDGANNLGFVNFTFILGRAQTSFVNSNSITINDATATSVGRATPYPSTIVISNLPGTITKVTVTLNNLTHDYPDDIDILLVSPTGQKVTLMSDAGGFNPLNNSVLTLDDAASSPLPDTAQIISGTYRPANYAGAGTADSFPPPAPAGPYDNALLSSFIGLDPNGTWSLYVVDDAEGQSGNIAGGWSLNLTTTDSLAPAADICITASDSPDPITIGGDLTYVYSITNFGPSTATGVVFTNILPAGVQYISSVHSTGGSSTYNPANNTLDCNVGTLASGAGMTITVVVRPNVAGTITSIATIRGTQPDVNPGNNTAAVKTTVTDVPLVATRQGNNVILSWPATANGFILQSCNTFPPTWTDIGPGVVSGGQYRVMVSISSISPGEKRFFRLRHP
jgi:uncharacterized delta-60 repeat protein/uncharacterized repeat protein (TIGR01451 family)